MHLLPLKITDDQKTKLFEIKKKEGIPVSVLIRKAINFYLKNREN